MRRFFAFSFGILFSGILLAQAWPTHPVRLIVPFPPGGGTDLASRSVAAKLAEALGQPVVIENRPGAGGTIGADAVAKAAPDGYTIGTATSSTHPASVALQKGVPYDPVKDFAPITQIASTSFVLLGSASLPASTFRELVAYSKANPGKLNVVHVGTTTLGYLMTLQLRALTGLDVQDIQYKGSSQAYPDLMSGQVHLFLDNPGASTPLVAAGRLKAFGVTTPTPSMPGVPRFTELGVKGYEADFWYGLVAPVGTPKPIVERIQQEVAKFVQSPEGRKEFAARSLVPLGSTPEQFAAAIQAEMERYRELAARLIRQ
jgi:tripartite-type tricarboxylate transporter receptor subunit TctC